MTNQTLGEFVKEFDCTILIAHSSTLEDLAVIINKLSELCGDDPYYAKKIGNIWSWLNVSGFPD